MNMNVYLSIIIPVLNEAEQLADRLQALQPLRERCQLLVVDGGSNDDSAAVVAAWVDQVLTGPRGPGPANECRRRGGRGTGAVVFARRYPLARRCARCD